MHSFVIQKNPKLETTKCPGIAEWMWDRLGPGAHCCSAATFTNISLNTWLWRDWKGQKHLHACPAGANYEQAIKKTKTPTATSKEAGAKAGYCTCPRHTPPPKGWVNHLSHPSSPIPEHTPTHVPCQGPADLFPQLREWTRVTVTCISSPLVQHQFQ